MTQPSLFDPIEGMRRKAEGVTVAAEHAETLLDRARRIATDLAKTYGEITADDVHRCRGGTPRQPALFPRPQHEHGAPERRQAVLARERIHVREMHGLVRRASSRKLEQRGADLAPREAQ